MTPEVELRFDAVSDVVVYEGDELFFEISTTVQPENIVVTLEAMGLPENAEFLDSGEGWGTLRFSPDYEQAGIYPIDFKAKAEGVTAQTRVIVTSVGSFFAFALPSYAQRDVFREDMLYISLLSVDWESSVPTFELTTELTEAILESDEDGEWLCFNRMKTRLKRFR